MHRGAYNVSYEAAGAGPLSSYRNSKIVIEYNIKY